MHAERHMEWFLKWQKVRHAEDDTLSIELEDLMIDTPAQTLEEAHILVVLLSHLERTSDLPCDLPIVRLVSNLRNMLADLKN